MGIGQLQFGGLASGLDTDAIISAILSAERRPIRLLENQQTEARTKLSLIGTFEGLVEDLQASARELTSSGSIFAHTVSVGDETLASFEVTGEPAAGSHTLEVLSLASAERITFANTAADPDAAFAGAGSISFDYDGTSYSVSIEDGASLNEIAAAIEDQAGEAVSASVVNTGTESSPAYQLVVSGDDTGEDFALESLSIDASLNLGVESTLTTASNATAVVDGLTVERSTNVFADVVPGLSFSVQAEGGPTTFTTALDVEGTTEKLRGFVDAYNAVIGFINQQNAFDEDAGPGGELFGDSLLRNVKTTISDALFDVDLQTVLDDTEGYSTLGLVGIELTSDGTLEIDEDLVESKLTANPEAFSALFDDSEDGLLVALDDAIDGLLDSTTTSSGLVLEDVFDSRRETLNTAIDSLDDQIERLERNLGLLEETLVARFANLESILGGLTSQSAFLATNFLQTNS